MNTLIASDDEREVGFVYILQVENLSLPVCKIGRTSKNPEDRCAEINRSSTGDFIWSVAYWVAVDDCRKLESLVHEKLTGLRQKGREIFSIVPLGAYLLMIAILNSRTDISEIANSHTTDMGDKTKKTGEPKMTHKPHITRRDSKYIELLQFFMEVLNVKGKPFGQLNKPTFGVSDGVEGVQWNMVIYSDTGKVRIGCNLEGKEYTGWPIANFIQSEMETPRINEIRSKLKRPKDVFIRFSRDAWQGTSRPDIVEKYIGGKVCSISQMTQYRWRSVLKEALGCLNEQRGYCGRVKQEITYAKKQTKGGQVNELWVTPHLTVWTALATTGNLKDNIRERISELQPVYDWMKEASQPR